VTSIPGRDLLLSAVRDAERHVASGGWDQGPRLFALVTNEELLEREPEVAQSLGIDGAAGWTPVEQEDLPGDPLDEVLASIAWPAEVDGALIVVERVVLPASVEQTLPTPEDSDDDDAEESAEAALMRVASSHPLRDEVRMAVGVLRDGSRACVLRLRAHDDENSLIVGEDLVPRLADALEATFSD
jgi:hypothetical protein